MQHLTCSREPARSKWKRWDVAGSGEMFSLHFSIHTHCEVPRRSSGGEYGVGKEIARVRRAEVKYDSRPQQLHPQLPSVMQSCQPVPSREKDPTLLLSIGYLQ